MSTEQPEENTTESTSTGSTSTESTSSASTSTEEAPRSTDEPGSSTAHGKDRELKGAEQDGYGNDTGFAEAAEDADENVNH